MMEVAAAVGGMVGQLTVGLAGGMTAGSDQGSMMNMATKLQAAAAKQKSTIGSLPDKV